MRPFAPLSRQPLPGVKTLTALSRQLLSGLRAGWVQRGVRGSHLSGQQAQKTSNTRLGRVYCLRTGMINGGLHEFFVYWALSGALFGLMGFLWSPFGLLGFGSPRCPHRGSQKEGSCHKRLLSQAAPVTSSCPVTHGFPVTNGFRRAEP